MRYNYKVMLCCFVTIFVLFLVVVFHYYKAFNIINNMVASANKTCANDFQGNEVISAENYENLSVVDRSVVGSGYVIGGSIPKIQGIGIHSITVRFSSSYHVIDEKTNETIYSSGKWELLVRMRFEKGKWIVDNVSKTRLEE